MNGRTSFCIFCLFFTCIRPQTGYLVRAMDAATNTARLARKRSAADTDRRERRFTGNSSRAAYSARAARRADRQTVRANLRALTR